LHFIDKNPLVFMTDDSCAEGQALQQVFPKSTLLLCAFVKHFGDGCGIQNIK